MKFLALSASLVFSTTAAAEHFYVGGNVGQAEVDDLCGELSDVGTVTSCDEKDTAFKLFAGYKFNQYFAVEGFYADFGEVSATVNGTDVDVDYDGYGLSVVGILPATDNFDVFAKLGYYHAEADASSSVGSVSSSGSDVTYGIGASYSFTEAFAVRAEWERFNTDDDADIDLLSAGVSYSF